MKDYYQILSVSRHAHEKEIKAAFRSLARQYTKDKNEEGYTALQEAYDTLSDATKRKFYDIEHSSIGLGATNSSGSSTGSTSRPRPPPGFEEQDLNECIQNGSNDQQLSPAATKFPPREPSPPPPARFCPVQTKAMKGASDLRRPETWYTARKMKRTVIYHCGPPNSGKSYDAIRRFLKADYAIYCCPLRLLAYEVANTSNEKGVPCDMVTGEERKLIHENEEFASHLATTIQMADTDSVYDVAIIDEIQMIAEPQNGWAYTKALQGLQASEIHVCGDKSAVDLVKRLVESVGDTFKTREHVRPNRLDTVESVELIPNIKNGDCVVCFSKKQICEVARELDRRGLGPISKIHGSMPPEAKQKQANWFNDTEDSHKILVATDAIGMGMNLQIHRVVFYTLKKFSVEVDGAGGVKELTPAQTMQIGGRAGRAGSIYAHGEVTTFDPEDYDDLVRLLGTPIEPITKAGLMPPVEFIEKFAGELQRQNENISILEVLKIYFEDMVQINEDLYFVCSLEDILFWAEKIEHLPMKIDDMYKFCTAPMDGKTNKHIDMFVDIATEYSHKKEVRADWLKEKLDWEQFEFEPIRIQDLEDCEAAYDVICLYMWFRKRFRSSFPDLKEIEKMRNHIVGLIDIAVSNMESLLDMGGKRGSSGKGSRRGRPR